MLSPTVNVSSNMRDNRPSGKSQSQEQSLGKYDVICGRHKDARDNVGNRRFRVLIAVSASKYNNAPSRAHKSAVIQNIMNTIQNAGDRFLHCPKRTHATGIWEEFDEKQTYDKIGHALRDMSVSFQTDDGRNASPKSRSSLASHSSPIILDDTVCRTLSSTPGPQVTSIRHHVPKYISMTTENDTKCNGEEVIPPLQYKINDKNDDENSINYWLGLHE
jgi:hypothetical protein